MGGGATGKEAYFENNEIKVRKKSYTVTVGTAANGTVSASPTSATAGTEVTLTVNPDSGYQLEALTAVSYTHLIYNQVWKAPINKGIKSLQVIIGRIRQKLLELCPGHE